MPNASWKAKHYAQCPFFLTDDPKCRRIVCEGFVDDSTVALTYRLRKGYDTQLSVFCCDHYRNCEVYRMVMAAKYDEEVNQ